MPQAPLMIRCRRPFAPLLRYRLGGYPCPPPKAATRPSTRIAARQSVHAWGLRARLNSSAMVTTPPGRTWLTPSTEAEPRPSFRPTRHDPRKLPVAGNHQVGARGAGAELGGPAGRRRMAPDPWREDRPARRPRNDQRSRRPQRAGRTSWSPGRWPRRARWLLRDQRRRSAGRPGRERLLGTRHLDWTPLGARDRQVPDRGRKVVEHSTRILVR